jgi:vacuolar-type H+-ATPase subunit H
MLRWDRRQKVAVAPRVLFGAVGFVLVVALPADGAAFARDAGVPPATSVKAADKSAKPGVTQNVKNLGKETTDPSTLTRIKAHEQELEKKIERNRDRQRKDHAEARPGDAVDLAKNLDAPDETNGKVSAGGEAKVDKKSKSDNKGASEGSTKIGAKPAAEVKTAPAVPPPAAKTTAR